MNQSHRFNFRRLAALALGTTGMSLAAMSARADVTFLGVAAGDATSNDAILWTRALDASAPGATSLTAQVAPNDPTITSGVVTFSATTDPAKDYTAKVVAAGLQSNTRYYYRFVSGTNASITGTFKTSPDAGTAAPVHFGFSGDCDGLIRPYDLAANFNLFNLDYFVFIGDVIYETASTGSPAVAATGTIPVPSTNGATQAQLFTDYSRKYREQFLPVNAGGQNGLQTFF